MTLKSSEDGVKKVRVSEARSGAEGKLRTFSRQASLFSGNEVWRRFSLVTFLNCSKKVTGGIGGKAPITTVP